MERAEFARTVGDNMRRYRDAYHLTQERFAEKVGISKSYCSAIESGAKIPSSYTIQIMAEALDISPLYFFIELPTGQDNMEKAKDELLNRIVSTLRHCSLDHLRFVDEILFLSRKYEVERIENDPY